MKKLISIVMIVMLTSCMLLTSALAAPEDTTTVDPITSALPSESPSPSPSPSYQPEVTGESDGLALLSKVVVSSVSQSTKNPNNTMNVSVELKNINTKEMNDVMVSVGGLSTGTISLTKTFGPFRTSMSAGGTGSVNFSLYAASTIVGGNFPITLTLTYVDEAGTTVSLDRGISILIDRGTGITGSQESALTTPRLFVESYSIGSNKVFGGDEFELTYTLVNSGSTGVKNLLLTLSSDTNAYTAKTGVSNQIYIGDIPGNGSYTGKITLLANSTLKTGTYNINFDLQYESVINTPYTSDSIISIAMDQEQVLSIGSIVLPETVLVNTKALLNVSYQNPGTTDIKNLVMNLTGNIPEDEKTVTIGNLKAGTSGNVDQYITPKSTGPQSIEVSFTFEDSSGNAYTTATRAITTDVQTDSTPTASSGASSAVPTDNVTQTGSTASPGLNALWLIFLIIGVLIAVVVVIIVFVASKQKKKLKKWNMVEK